MNYTDPTGYAPDGDATAGAALGSLSFDPISATFGYLINLALLGTKPNLPSPNSLPGVTAQGGPFGQGTGGACGSMSNNACGGMVLTMSGAAGSVDSSPFGRTLGIDDPYWAERMFVEDLLRNALDELVLDALNAAWNAQKAARKGEYDQAAVLAAGFVCDIGKVCKGVGRVIELGADHAKTFAKAARGAGRTGRQERLREIANDPKASSADRGWIQNEQRQITQGNRDTIRNPPGKDLAHERGREAAKGYSYEHSNLQDRDLHRLQHKYDDFGRANAERPPE